LIQTHDPKQPAKITMGTTPWFRERLNWLSRMPTHWRILLLSQTFFTLGAFSYRQVVVARRRHQLSPQQPASDEPPPATATTKQPSAVPPNINNDPSSMSVHSNNTGQHRPAAQSKD
jgi:hypothetical protein